MPPPRRSGVATLRSRECGDSKGGKDPRRTPSTFSSDNAHAVSRGAGPPPGDRLASGKDSPRTGAVLVFSLSKEIALGRNLRRVPDEDKPPVTCIYCGELIAPGQPATIVTKTWLDESGDPDLTSNNVEGIAHPECWERERPDVSEETYPRLWLVQPRPPNLPQLPEGGGRHGRVVHLERADVIGVQPDLVPVLVDDLDQGDVRGGHALELLLDLLDRALHFHVVSSTKTMSALISSAMGPDPSSRSRAARAL
jgi:hypothetical protein